MWRDIFMLNRVDLIKALAGMQVSLNNLLELITETKQIPDVFSHLELLNKELDEIKSFKEDKFWFEHFAGALRRTGFQPTSLVSLKE